MEKETGEGALKKWEEERVDEEEEEVDERGGKIISFLDRCCLLPPFFSLLS